ncbi:MAG: pantetheine-phosphate adenylyltransferase [Paludibacteraceae bacterium]
MRTALFPGTFNPFTRGHQDIVARGLRLFDHIIIGVGRNTAKNPHDDADERAVAIAALYAAEPRVTVRVYDTLTVDFAKEVGARFVLRGVRNVADFEYERQMADVNRMLDGLETVFLFAAADKVEISSSLVRELQAFGKDVSDYLPSADDAGASL